ncbi:Arogenate dehydratase/prephenate dehydratase 2 [Hibiscus syriacus]|uniref:Arogenate dehydratase n=1 Tax=Hibiscus syriacus TaxID=106335 RepID=A0A6A3ASA6_HIBSY|nr:arogenate dehydratase/prephenate dehydratase 2, chloroplastic-like [Hibiscus syriacus]XP_038999087.1 arogenate dehydratase/prephenate dehydratase 2, chloroplastic-like [Hibiscus syriacus]KAE8705762.1 Arogenate dehydratase/prephenate dehydratase 2 [Hibiscus syriacus]
MATATSIIRSPAVLLSGKGTVYDQKTSSPFQIPQFSLKRRRFTSLFASLHDGNNINDGSNKIAKAVGLEKLFVDSPYDVVSKDSPSHPRPLTSAQLSNTISDGPRLRVAYQEFRGAYSEAAAEKAYPNCEPVPCDQFDVAFEAVEKWLVDRAVLPIENSLGGSIHRNYDLLLRHSLHIVGEVKLAVRHCLLANHGVRVEDLKRVLSHPQALAQCEYTLTKIGLSREAVDDTALAAKHVAFEKLKDTGAVASSKAAKIYGLNILAEDIQDDCDNVTRFLMLARDPIIPGVEKPFKTSIVFSLEEGPGVLFKALAVFALRQINLTKIESRPLRNQPLRASDDGNNGSKYFDYLFYVDFEASMAEERAQNALRHLMEFATFLRVLGSYPVDTTML